MFKTILADVLVSVVSGCVTSESPTSKSAAQAKSARITPTQVILGTAY